MKSKKHLQLGMNPATARGRLVKDILFTMVLAAGHTCHQCGEVLTRETFSVEHKEPWLDSDDPVGLYFDLDNIAFSHLSCNSGAARKVNKLYDSTREQWKAASKRRTYNPEKRRDKYVRIGT